MSKQKQHTPEQIVQDSLDPFRIRIVPGEDYGDGDRK